MAKVRLKILVLDGDMVSALAIARSLRRKGYQVDLAGHVDKPLASYSWSVSDYLKYPDPLELAEAFVKRLLDILAERQYAMVIPVTERTILPLRQHSELFKGTQIAMAEADSLDAVLDKTRTFALARELGIPVPGGHTIKSVAELENAALPPFPLVLKPARSVGEDLANRSQLKVDYAFDQEELVKKAEYFLRFGELIVQQYVRGVGVGVEVLASYGNILYEFQHQRLHEVPLTGGGSSFRKSVPVDLVLLEAARKLVAALVWNGVAMVEFKKDPASGKFYLMEINGRFWGSLPLAVAAGADFPGMLAEMLLEGETSFSKNYREGILCRRMTSDVHWYELALREAAPAQLEVIPSRRRMLADFLLMFSWKHRFDVQSLVDPLPGWVELSRLIKSYFGRFRAVIGEKSFYRRQTRLWRNGTVEKALKAADSLLFVCYGNINRSAVAELQARHLGLEKNFRISSTGFHKESDRPMDPEMAIIASENGLVTENFLSTVMSDELVEGADVILVMEKKHFDDLVERYPSKRSVTFLLGAAMTDPGDSPVISDPYNKAPEQYERCFREIAGSVQVISELVKR